MFISIFLKRIKFFRQKKSDLQGKANILYILKRVLHPISIFDQYRCWPLALGLYIESQFDT